MAAEGEQVVRGGRAPSGPSCGQPPRARPGVWRRGLETGRLSAASMLTEHQALLLDPGLKAKPWSLPELLALPKA